MQAVEMLVGNDHAVSRGVGKGIEDDEVVLAAMDDQRLLVIAGAQQFAKNAGRRRCETSAVVM